MSPSPPEPDVRFSFANERTFLAWMRTAIALVVAGLAVVQLLPPFPGVPWGRHIIGTPLIILGGIIAVLSYREWSDRQRGIHRGEHLRTSPLPRILAVTIAVIAVVAISLALASGPYRHG